MWRALTATILALVLAPPLGAQSCNTLTGGVNCGTVRRDADSGTRSSFDDAGRSMQYRSFQSLGSELSFAGEQNATLGAITFSESGRQCGGLFRVSRC